MTKSIFKRCEQCGMVACTTLPIKVGSLERNPLLCDICQKEFTASVGRLLIWSDNKKEVKILKKVLNIW